MMIQNLGRDEKEMTEPKSGWQVRNEKGRRSLFWPMRLCHRSEHMGREWWEMMKVKELNEGSKVTQG